MSYIQESKIEEEIRITAENIKASFDLLREMRDLPANRGDKHRHPVTMAYRKADYLRGNLWHFCPVRLEWTHGTIS